MEWEDDKTLYEEINGHIWQGDTSVEEGAKKEGDNEERCAQVKTERGGLQEQDKSHSEPDAKKVKVKKEP